MAPGETYEAIDILTGAVCLMRRLQVKPEVGMETKRRD
jgi:hypothetical protein